MSGSHRHLVDDDDDEFDDDDEEEDGYMYSVDMNLDEGADYRVACRASKASEWNRPQE